MDTPVKRINLFMPIIKNVKTGKYSAVLSDDSIDREDEIMDKCIFEKAQKESGFLPALMDHENKCLSTVALWINKRIGKSRGHNALFVDPYWLMSNPATTVIKGMIDEAAEINASPFGLSIGAIPKAFNYKEINGKRYKNYTDVEIVEGSFTPVPANKHAIVMAIAKSLSEFKNTEEKTMEQPPEQDNSKNPRDAMNGVSTGAYGEDKNKIADAVMAGVKQAANETINMVSEYKALKAEVTELKKQVDDLTLNRKAQLDVIKNAETGAVEGDAKKPKDNGEDSEESEDKLENKSMSDLLATIQK